jgi:hypothetical protein
MDSRSGRLEGYPEPESGIADGSDICTRHPNGHAWFITRQPRCTVERPVHNSGTLERVDVQGYESRFVSFQM